MRKSILILALSAACVARGDLSAAEPLPPAPAPETSEQRARREKARADDEYVRRAVEEQRRAMDVKRRDFEAAQRKLLDEFRGTEARMKAVEDARTQEQGAVARQKLDAERAQLIETLKVQQELLQQLKQQQQLEVAADAAHAPADVWRNDILKALDRKVSFEFVDTPLAEACEFVRHIAGVNVIVDPKSIENGAPPINLRVADMKLSDALTWVCKLAGQKYELRNQSVFITADQDGAPKADAAKDAPAVTVSGKLRVKLANGNELEADSSVFVRNPELVAGIAEQVLGVTDRRIAGVPLAKDNPARQPLIELLSAHKRNDVKIEYHEELNLLLISGKNTSAVNELYGLAKLALDAHRQFTPRERPPMMPATPRETRPQAVPQLPSTEKF